MRKKIFASFMAALITAISLSGCSRAENSQEMAKSNAGESEIETDSGEVDEIVFAYFTQNNIPETSELQRIEDLLNEYTVEKINTNVCQYDEGVERKRILGKRCGDNYGNRGGALHVRQLLWRLYRLGESETFCQYVC